MKTKENIITLEAAKRIVRCMHKYPCGGTNCPSYAPHADVYGSAGRMWKFALEIARRGVHPHSLSRADVEEISKVAMLGDVKKMRRSWSNNERIHSAKYGYGLYSAMARVRMMRQDADGVKLYTGNNVPSYDGCIKLNIIKKNDEIRKISSLRRSRLGLTQRPASLCYSGNYFSAELEFVCKINTPLANGTFDWDTLSHPDVSFVRDGSVGSSQGLVIAAYQEAIVSCKWGKTRALYDTCRQLEAAGAQVNTSTGLHIHLDARHLGPLQERGRRMRLISALRWLLELVPISRRSNSFCVINLPGRGRGGRSRERYQAINPQSYRKHKTTEIRLGSGSLDPDKIINWAALMLFIAENKKKLPTFESFLLSKCPEHLKVWAVLRRNKFKPIVGNEAEGSES